jgi:hypothetical protein
VRRILYPHTDLTTPRHYGVLIGGDEGGLDEKLYEVRLIDGAPPVRWCARRRCPDT